MLILCGLEDRRILSGHIFGESGTELSHIGQAMIGLGVSWGNLVETVFNYPTLAETYKIAALNAWNKTSAQPG